MAARHEASSELYKRFDLILPKTPSVFQLLCGQPSNGTSLLLCSLNERFYEPI